MPFSTAAPRKVRYPGSAGPRGAASVGTQSRNPTFSPTLARPQPALSSFEFHA
jgi:hypothetical protein